MSQPSQPGEVLITRTRGVFPRVYLPPFGGPLYWGDERSGALPAAVVAYFGHRTGEGTLTPEQVDLLSQYIDYYIHAPCWRGSDELDALRAKAAELRTVEQIGDWIDQALELGIDPF